MKLPKNVRVWVIGTVIAAVALGLGWRFFSTRSSAVSQTSRLMTVRVERGDLEVRVSGTGAVEAAAQEEVRTRISGTITRFDVKDGEQVKAGQVLAELDAPDLRLQIEKARLDVAIQERELATLLGEKTFEQVKSPGDGEITWKVKEGDRVQEGNVIATIQNRKRLELVGKFNSAQVEHIKPGQEAVVFLQEFLLNVPARVVEVSAEPRPAGAGAILYEVKAEINNPGGLDAGIKGWLTVLTPAGEIRAVQEGATSLPKAMDVRAPISGSITALRVDNGKSVGNGQVLAELSDPDRAGQLANQIALAELRLQQARLDLQDKEGNRRVIAPIDGIMVLPAAPKGVGDDVSQGTVLGTVVDYSQMQVDIPVDELDVAKVKPGQQVRITADALPGNAITGLVQSIAFQGTSQNGVATFDVRVAIEPADGLRGGMTVHADILVDRRQNTLLVPIEAVQQGEGRSSVLVPEGSGRSPRPVRVKTGAYDTSRIEILEGLEEGQEILIMSVTNVSGNRSRLPGSGSFLPPGMGGNGGFVGPRPTDRGTNR